MPEQPQQKVLPESDDQHYPRPDWVRRIRGALRFWWLLFVAYGWTVFFNVLALVGNSTRGLEEMRNGAKVVQVLMVGWFAHIWEESHTLCYIVAFAIAVCLTAVVSAGYWATTDYEHERLVLLERRLLDKMASKLRR